MTRKESRQRQVARLGRFELGRTLGEGAAGKVKFAVDAEDARRTAYAIKVLDRRALLAQNMLSTVKQEIRVMRALRHPCIVRLYEVMASQRKVFMVIELVKGGELYDAVGHYGHLTEAKARRYLQQLVDALDYCHSKGVYHRDLKPENILVDSEADMVKIADFGLAAVTDVTAAAQDRMLKTLCGTPNYIAPEVLREEAYDGALADVWSLGVCAFMMVCGRLPFHHESLPELYRVINSADYRLPGFVSPSFASLLSKMLEPDPTLRATLEEIRVDPWFRRGYEPIHPLPDGSQLRRLKTRPVGLDAGAEAEQLMRKVTLGDFSAPDEWRQSDSDGGGSGGSATPPRGASPGNSQHGPSSGGSMRRVASLNAFELIAFASRGLDLSAMFEKRADVAGRHTRFCASCEVDVLLDAIRNAAERLPGVAINTDDEDSDDEDAVAEVRLDWQGERGKASMRCELFRLAPGVLLCDACRIIGDGLEVHAMYNRLVSELPSGLVLKNRDSVTGGFTSEKRSRHDDEASSL